MDSKKVFGIQILFKTFKKCSRIKFSYKDSKNVLALKIHYFIKKSSSIKKPEIPKLFLEFKLCYKIQKIIKAFKKDCTIQNFIRRSKKCSWIQKIFKDSEKFLIKKNSWNSKFDRDLQKQFYDSNFLLRFKNKCFKVQDMFPIFKKNYRTEIMF